jgi:hypothetical protein
VDLDTARQPRPRGVLDWRADAGPLVTALYQAHGVGLIRLAVVMLGDRPAAEDVVQEAFCGLYRRWDHLDDPGNALRYLRSSVLNGCRSVLRNLARLHLRLGQEPGRAATVESALRFNPAHGTATLTAVALPESLEAAQVGGIGLSPDGSKLALSLRRSVQMITLASGAKREWVLPGSGWAGNFKPFGQPFSWTADGRKLAFQQWGGKFDSTAHVRVLDTTAPGSSLLSAKLVVTFPNQAGVMTFNPGNTLMTPDGTKIVTATTIVPREQSRPEQLAITKFSTRTGKVVASEDRFEMRGWQEVLWTSPSGSTLIVTDSRGKQGASVTGVLTGGRFTTLPRAPQTNQIAW